MQSCVAVAVFTNPKIKKNKSEWHLWKPVQSGVTVAVFKKLMVNKLGVVVVVVAQCD